ncbi:MAG: amidohydrolase family protein [Cardiobacteriaceae bacterium]|nr:amidohydrolase family protein [Cardiobacteriaceae bacterium]
MHTVDLLIRGDVITAAQRFTDGYVAIAHGKVVAVGDASAGMPQAAHVEDYRGALILPAAIDAQVHSRSQAGQEDFLWSTRAAAAGGVGTIVDMPYDAGSLIANVDNFRAKREAAEAQARVDFALYATVHPEEGKQRIADLVAEGAAGFKFSTFGTDPVRFPRIAPAMMHECFAEIARYGLVAGVHNEDDETVKTLLSRAQENGETDYAVHTRTRPIYAENLAIQQIYELGADTGCRAHVVHCSNARGYEICQSFREQGFPATIEACLHYLVLSEDEDVSRLVGRGKVNPPIRHSREREAIWQHLAAGNVTVVSTDHVSWSSDRKDNPDMLANASGATGLELLVALVVDGAVARGVDLRRVAQVLAYNPARLFSLQGQKGALEVGCDADLVILRHAPRVYSAKESGHNFTDWSPYDGRTVNHRVEKTMVRGEWVFADGEVLAEPGTGRFVRPLEYRA